MLKNFSTESAWTLLNELIQNAVDTGATNISLHIENDAMIMQHNGKKKLTQEAIEGLCAFNMSTKRLDSVGFMGLGFKSFVHYFSKVTIADDDVKFSTECPITGIAFKDIQQLYAPYWINDDIAFAKGMTTYFKFDEPRKGTMEKIENALSTYDTKKLAILSKNGLQKLCLDEIEYTTICEGDIVTVNCPEKELHRNYIVLEEKIEFSTQITQQLAEHRGEPTFYIEGEITKRKLRLIKEIEIKVDSEGVKLLKTKSAPGEMYCLVPLNKTFPFNFTVDCEWLMTATRSDLVNTYPEWHKTILRKLPILIRRYLSLINPSDSKSPRVHRSEKERRNWTDIFSKDEVDDLDSEHPAINFIKTPDFDDILREELNKIRFIKCRDGKYRSPNNVRRIPNRLTWNAKLKGEDFDSFTKNCFDCHILDESSMPKNAINYLKWCEIIRDPLQDEIKQEEVKKWWNKKKPERYKEILDILSEITSKDEEGPEVVPLTNDNWANLKSPNIIFDFLPNRGGERELRNALIKNHPPLKEAQEVITELKEEYEYSHNAGSRWRNCINVLDVDVASLIRTDKTRRTKKYILARFEYCLRSNQPDLVSKLLTRKDTIANISDIYLGPPFVSKSLVSRIAGDKLQTTRVNKLMDKLGKSVSETKAFLIKAGVIRIKPTERTTLTKDHHDVSLFLGIDVHQHTRSGGKFRATFAGPGKSNQDEGWRKIEVVWPFEIEEYNRMDELSDFLCNPTEDLLEQYRRRLKADEGERIEWYFSGNKEEPSNNLATWIVDLQNIEWVKCSDGVIRKPSDSPLEEGDGEYHAEIINKKVSKIYERLGIKFGQDTDSMDDQQVLQWWRNHAVRDNPRLIKILKERGLKGDALRAEIQDLQFTSTNRGKAPFRRFITNTTDTLGGYFGEWGELPDELRKFLKGKMEPPQLSAEMLVQFVESLTLESPTYIDDNIEHLQNAHAQLFNFEEESIDVKLLTYGDEWVMTEDTPYILLTADRDKSEGISEKIVRIDQFPPNFPAVPSFFDSYNLKLFDDELTIVKPDFAAKPEVVNVSRVVRSLNLHDSVHVNWTTAVGIKALHRGDEISLTYLIMADGGYKIYLSKDGRDWSKPVGEFLLGQSELEMTKRGKDTVIRALRHFDNGGKFEEIYGKLCQDNDLQFFDFDGTARDYRSAFEESSHEMKADIHEQSSERKQGKLKDYRKEGQKKQDKTIKTLGTQSSKSKKGPKKKSSDAGPISPLSKRNPAESKEIGDKAEDLIQKLLAASPSEIEEQHPDVNEYPFNLQWDVVNTNKEYRKNFPGYDLEATREDKRLRVEVKGIKEKWNSVALTPTEIKWAYKTIEDETDDDGLPLEYWICIVENVFENFEITAIDWTKQAGKTEITFKETTWGEK